MIAKVEIDFAKTVTVKPLKPCDMCGEEHVYDAMIWRDFIAEFGVNVRWFCDEKCAAAFRNLLAMGVAG